MLKISFKNVFQKNVSITIFIIGVKNVALIPIRDARGNRTLDFQLSDDGVHPNAGGCRFRRAPSIVSGVGVSKHDPVCPVLESNFKNVFQKNVSITIFVFGV